MKFVERNWKLGTTLSARSRDNLPNPIQHGDDVYVPRNMPAIGDLFDVNGVRLASGFYSPRSEIRLRALTFGQDELTAELIAQRIDAAIARRRRLLGPNTNAIRMINADGDDLSGLVIDLYNDVVVAEIANAGIERLKPMILEADERIGGRLSAKNQINVCACPWSLKTMALPAFTTDKCARASAGWPRRNRPGQA